MTSKRYKMTAGNIREAFTMLIVALERDYPTHNYTLVFCSIAKTDTLTVILTADVHTYENTTTEQE